MVSHKDGSGNNITLSSVVDDCKALTWLKTSIASGKLIVAWIIWQSTIKNSCNLFVLFCNARMVMLDLYNLMHAQLVVLIFVHVHHCV